MFLFYMVVMKLRSLNYQEMLRFYTKDGMEVVLLKDLSHSTYIQLDIDFGSFDLMYENEQNQLVSLTPGIAHFLEHKMFAMDDQTDAFTYFTQLGLQANAMTSYETTSYTLAGNENVEEGLLYLLKMIDKPYFTEENVDQEFNIIAEEIRMYNDDVDSVIQLKILRMLMDKHPIIHDIAGRIEDIELIDVQMLEEAYQNYYQPKRRKLMISGPIDLDTYQKLILSHDSPWDTRPTKTYFPKERKEVVSSFEVIQMDVVKPKLVVGFKFNMDKKGLALLKEEIIAVTAFNFLFGMLSDFYEKAVDADLINEPIGYQLINEGHIFTAIIQTESFDLLKLDALLKSTVFNFDENSFSEEVLSLIKKIMIGQQIFSLNEFENKLYLFSKYDPYNVSFDDVIDLIQQTSKEEIIQFIKSILPEQLSTLYVERKIDDETDLVI